MPTPAEWLQKLEEELEKRRPRIQRYEDYYDGKHRLAFATSKFREAFGNLFSAFADNWCDLVVDASVERLRVDGFRFDTPTRSKAAWRIWQANQLDAESVLSFTEAVKCGTSFLLVSPNVDDPKNPLVTVEHPAQVIVAHAPGFRRKRLAALKKWLDDDGFAMATLYLPDAVHKYRSDKKLTGSTTKVRWVDRPGADPVANDLGIVPVVPLLNNPTLLGGGQSDIAKVIPLQDAVNKLVSDMLVASEFAAFRQRWATGIEIPTDPETGQAMPTKEFLNSVSRIWTVGNDAAQFGEFSATDLNNYVQGVEMLVQHVAAQTRTPPHYLLGQSGNFPSGESLKSTETGLVAKVLRKHLSFGEGLEEAQSLALVLSGDTRAMNVSAETIWKDPESRTEGEHVDAVLKMATLGVPQVVLWERLGASPEEIERWKELKAAEPPPPTQPAPAMPAAPTP